MTNTALRAENSNSRTITFKSKEHEKFYMEYLKKCRYQDVYHQALVYCLGIDRDTRENVNKIYNFKTGCVKTESLQEGWQTSGSLRIVRMAFNLYCNGTPSIGSNFGEAGRVVGGIVGGAVGAVGGLVKSVGNAIFGGGGCYITTATCEEYGKSDNCYELTMFRSFHGRAGYIACGVAYKAAYGSTSPAY